ncbi:MAG TPA: hypothetical protein VFH57_04110 [Gammaproteobacteria bacterium]|nr:hypothetical protein [Gammaproteobacteria bacterium]
MHKKPWWLEAGAASCGFCAVAYLEEVAVHCFECDRPICPVCVVEVRESRTVVCPECAP